MWFASDNAGPAHPSVIAALARANEGSAASYGAEAAMGRVTAALRALFEAPEAAVFLVATGTAANALALACLAPPWGAIYCHREAHVAVDECGAPEFYTGGAKLVLMDGAHGRIDPEDLAATLAGAAPRGVHGVQNAALSLTNATEAGSVYTPAEIAALTAVARAHGMAVHLDGARLANALAHLGCSPAELTWKAGVDVLSFGGTKNGLVGVEAVILFDPARAWEFELRRKRGGHLFSKHRYLSAQMEAYLEGDLWRDLALRANARAATLAKGLAAFDRVRLFHPTEANLVMAAAPRRVHRALRAASAVYGFWPHELPMEGPGEDMLPARFACNWATSEAEVAQLVALTGAAAERG